MLVSASFTKEFWVEEDLVMDLFWFRGLPFRFFLSPFFCVGKKSQSSVRAMSQQNDPEKTPPRLAKNPGEVFKISPFHPFRPRTDEMVTPFNFRSAHFSQSSQNSIFFLFPVGAILLTINTRRIYRSHRPTIFAESSVCGHTVHRGRGSCECSVTSFSFVGILD